MAQNDYFTEYKTDFISETEEEIERLEEYLLNLDETKEYNEEIFSEIYRIFHTIKGASGFLGLENVSKVAHTAEELINEIKKQKIFPPMNIINTLFETIDFFKKVLKELGEKEEKPVFEIEKIKTSLEECFNLLKKENLSISAPTGTKKVEVLVKVLPDAQMKSMKAFLVYNKLKKKYTVKSEPEPDNFKENVEKGEPVKFLLENVDSIEEVKNIINTISDIQIVKIGYIREERKEKRVRKAEVELDTKFVKVPIERLDVLLNLIGELVIANAGFNDITMRIRDIYKIRKLFMEMREMVQQLSRISRELQEGIMKARMVPVREIFGRFRRFIRDYSQGTGKRIRLMLKGGDTEIDKKIINVLQEPLIHLMRNAIDHGIETVEERKAKGKPEEGVITVSAYQEGNFLIISIEDDGRGIDVEKIRQKAIEKGLVDEKRLSEMSREEIINLIFTPGFSTADKVTEISGRGIGMDVVKSRLEEIQGSISIESEKDKGTKFLLKIPITLAIISAIITKCGEEVFAIPMSSVNEIVKITSDDILTIEGFEAVKIRNVIIPLLRLDEILETPDRTTYTDNLTVIVVSYLNRNVGLIVDEIVNKQEIVIKPLTGNFRNIRGISGASILGDGSVILIIDAHDIIEIAKEKFASLPPEKRIKLPETFEIKESGEFKPSILSGRSVKELEEEIARVKAKIGKKEPEERTLKKFVKAISMGNDKAIESIKMMTGKGVKATPPVLKLITVQRLIDQLKRLTVPVIGVNVSIKGEIKGDLLFIFKEQNFKELASYLLGEENELFEEQKSAVGELVNIVGSSYVGALITLTDFNISPAVPVLYKGVGEILKIPFFLTQKKEMKIIMAQINFIWEDKKLLGYLFLMFTEEDLEKIIRRL